MEFLEMLKRNEMLEARISKVFDTPDWAIENHRGYGSKRNRRNSIISKLNAEIFANLKKFQ